MSDDTLPATTRPVPTDLEDDFERFRVQSRREILHLLRGMMESGERVSLVFSRGADSLLSMLLDIDERRNIVVLDWGGSEAANARLLASERCTFLAYPGGVRVQFAAGRILDVDFGGGKAFMCKLPREMIRLQRRESFRISLPVAQPLLCQLDAAAGERLNFPMHDISVGGVAFVSSTAPGFKTLTRFPRARFDLSEFGKVETGLDVRHITETRTKTGRLVWHIGCRFDGIGGQMQAMIQRFMVRLESERRARIAEE